MVRIPPARAPPMRNRRRRLRPFLSSSLHGDDYNFQENAANRAGGGGGEGGPKAEEGSGAAAKPPPPSPNVGVSDSDRRIGEIDAILERRAREGLPDVRESDACVVYQYEAVHGSETVSNPTTSEGMNEDDDDDDDDGTEAIDETTPCRRVTIMRVPTTDDDLAAAHEDVFGRPLHPRRALIERRLASLELEVMKLPEHESRALEKAMDENPLLFEKFPHTKLLLEEGGDDDNGSGDFDAAAAARRLAKYWEARRSLLGDDLCYSGGSMAAGSGTNANNDFGVHCQRYYKRTRDVLNDPLSDEMLREDAKMVIRTIEWKNLEAMDTVLRRMEEKHLAEQENHFDQYVDRTSNEKDPAEAGEEQPSPETSAWRMARKTSRELKLQFLHVEDMAIVPAAARLVRYWEMGLWLFGPTFAPTKKVTLDDISDDCSSLLDTNMFRLVPEDDDFGRSIICKVITKSDSARERNAREESSTMAKVLWYIIHAALERDSCRRNGFILLADSRKPPKNWKTYRRQREAVMNVIQCVPVKLCAIHIWLNDSSWFRRALFKGFSYVAGVWLRRRIVVHVGTTEQVLAEMGRSYGIGVEELPEEFGGAVGGECFSRWLEERRAAGL